MTTPSNEQSSPAMVAVMSKPEGNGSMSDTEQNAQVEGFNGGYKPDGTWRWHVFNPNSSPLEKKQVELDCMTRLKRIQEERTAHWRGIAEQVDAMPKDWSLEWSAPEACWQVIGANGWGSDDYTFGVIGSGSSPVAAIQSALSKAQDYATAIRNRSGE